MVRNTAPAAAVVAPFPVEVTFNDAWGVATESVTATALPAPVTVAPGADVPWSVTVANPPRTPVPKGAKASVTTWRWGDPALAAACPR